MKIIDYRKIDDIRLLYEIKQADAFFVQTSLRDCQDLYCLMNNEELVGWIFIQEQDTTILILDLFIKEAYRGHHYSEKLLDEVTVRSKQKGYDSLVLTTTIPNLFERYHFQVIRQVGTRKTYLKKLMKNSALLSHKIIPQADVEMMREERYEESRTIDEDSE